jgi:acetyl-CoA carboxylase biotin carboxylase subunit
VYSEADKELPFVSYADEAVLIGPPPVNKSYLNMEEILKIAIEKKVDAIHPGYGLMSENATFAQKVMDHGFIWIGPKPSVISRMGDKVMARKAMIEAEVPVIVGTNEVVTVEEAKLEATQLGYPVLLKANAGGGEIGMQACQSEEELVKFFAAVQNKAKAYFGDSTLFLEKWVERSRHVEVQIVADHHGNLIHMFERECSVQRRNQKVIEEALSPSIQGETREKLHQAALKVAKAVNYTGVGTVEFLVDEDDHFYFLEMNTRLQVEHPITECVTGMDLVSLQIDIEENKLLPVTQDDLFVQGHAMEFRIYAEDPYTMFPSPGKLSRFILPTGDGVRVDYGVEEGNEVTPFYDPMIAKCIVSGDTREEVIGRNKQALMNFEVEGIQTNIPVLLRVLEDLSFVKGKYNTKLLHQIKETVR